MRDILQPQQLVAVDFACRGASCELLRLLVPDLDVPLKEPERALNLSANDAALEALQARYHAGETLDRSTWEAVLRENAARTGNRGITAYTPDEIAALQQRYDQHLDRIGGMPGVTLLR